MEVVFKNYDFFMPACAVVKVLAPNSLSEREIHCHQAACEASEVVVRYYADISIGNDRALVIERCHIGSLYHHLCSVRKGVHQLTPKDKIEMCERLAKGLSELHRAKIAHRDIKPENILINSKGQPVYSDFGESKIVTNSEPLSTIVGTVTYLDPKILSEHYEGHRKTEYNPFALDVWCLGHVFCDILAGQVLRDFPSKQLTQRELDTKIKGLLRNTDAPLSAVEIALRMLKYNEFERLKAEDVQDLFSQMTLPSDALRLATSSLFRLSADEAEHLMEDEGACQPELTLS
jgi:serine/threonine protein kinase